MRLIFLDIDGVLNSQLFYMRRAAGEFSTHDLGDGNNIDPQAVGYLNQLIKDTGAKVVVSSTWRLGREPGELQALLEKTGFVGEVIGTTPDMRYGHGEHGDSILRGNEILAWIKEHPSEVGCAYHDYKQYIILDDDSDMLYWQRNNFFQCDGFVGLTPNVVYKAKRFLTL